MTRRLKDEEKDDMLLSHDIAFLVKWNMALRKEEAERKKLFVDAKQLYEHYLKKKAYREKNKEKKSPLPEFPFKRILTEWKSDPRAEALSRVVNID